MQENDSGIQGSSQEQKTIKVRIAENYQSKNGGGGGGRWVGVSIFQCLTLCDPIDWQARIQEW